MDFHTKAVEDIFLYLTAESDNFFASCSSFINKDKSLFVMNSGTPESLSLPTTLVNKPAGRQLYHIISGRVPSTPSMTACG